MALRLTLVSHAATGALKKARFAADEPIEIDGESDEKLNVCVGRRTRFIHGPELRTRQTAALFSQVSQPDDALRDYDFGRWKGCALDEIARDQQDALTHWMTDWQAAPHGGESVEQLFHRVRLWMDGLTGDGHVVAITHPFILRAALMRVLQCPPSAFHSIDVEPMSAVDLRFNGIWRMRLVSPTGPMAS